jgi:hypothetical protein
MAKNRKGTLPILIDLHYKYSINEFEEFYGDTVSYSEIEQTSYIDLKEMVFEKINRGIKFRKFGRNKRVLTVKMDIKPDEYEKFLSIFREEEIDEEATNDLETNPDGIVKYNRFNFLHDFTISNIRDLTNEERIKFKKAVVEEEDEELVESDDVDDMDNDNDD